MANSILKNWIAIKSLEVDETGNKLIFSKEEIELLNAYLRLDGSVIGTGFINPQRIKAKDLILDPSAPGSMNLIDYIDQKAQNANNSLNQQIQILQANLHKAQNELDKTIADFAEAKIELGNILADDVITSFEKNYLKSQRDSIKQEYPIILNQANVLSIPTNVYINAYSTLVGILDSIINSPETNVSIDAQVVEDAFDAYYGEKANIQNAIVNANTNKITQLEQTLRQEIANAIASSQTAIDNLETIINTTFADNIVSTSEQRSIQLYLATLSSEKAALDARYAYIYENDHLKGDAKTELAEYKLQYNAAYDALVLVLSSAIYDGQISVIERETVTEKLDDYRVKLAVLGTALDISINTILDNAGLGFLQDAKDYVNSILTNYVLGSEYAEDIAEIRNQIDGGFEQWYGDGPPTMDNFPAVDWYSTELLAQHRSDLYYDNLSGYAYRFVFNTATSTYGWIQLSDSDVAKALQDAAKALDLADGKRRVFLVQPPSGPYDIGDLWLNNGELYVAKTAKLENQAFTVLDWEKATKYTDDTLAQAVQDNLSNLSTIVTGNYNTLNGSLNDLQTTMTGSFRDGIIVESERYAINKYIATLNTDKGVLDEDYFSIHSDLLLTGAYRLALENAKTQFDTAHSELISVIQDAIADNAVNILEITAVNTKLEAYKTKLRTLSIEMQSSLKFIATERERISKEDAIQEAKDYADNLANGINQEISDINLAVSELENNIGEVALDGVLDATEKNRVKGYIIQLQIQKTEFDARYEIIYNDSYLDLLDTATVSDKTNLDNKKDTFDLASNGLIGYIEFVVNGDAEFTPEEAQNIETEFYEYRTALQDLQSAIETALGRISTNKAKDARTLSEQYADSIKNQLDTTIGTLTTNFENYRDEVETVFRDGIIDEAEKIAIHKYSNILETAKNELDAKYNIVYNDSFLLGVRKTELQGAKSDYNTAYTVLTQAITDAIADGTASNTDIATVNTKFAEYRIALNNLSTAFENAYDTITTEKNKSYFQDSKDYADQLKLAIDADIADIQGFIDNFEFELSEAVKDGIISTTEAKSIEKYINILNAEKASLAGRYTAIINDSSLTASFITSLQNIYNDFDVAHNTLKTVILSAIQDETVSGTEQTDINTAFDDYSLTLTNLSKKLDEALSIIADIKIGNTKIGGRNLIFESDLWEIYNGASLAAGAITLAKESYTYLSQPVYKITINCSTQTIVNALKANPSQVGIRTKRLISLKATTPYINSIFWKVLSSHTSTEISLLQSNVQGYETIKNEIFPDNWRRTSGKKKTAANITADMLYYTFSVQDATLAVGHIYEIVFSCPQLDESDLVTSYTPAPEDIDNRIQNVAQQITDTSNIITAITSDSKLSPAEKKAFKLIYDGIIAEVVPLITEATNYGVSSSIINALNASVNGTTPPGLVNYCAPFFADLETISEPVDGEELRNKFTNYYNQKANVLTAISNIQKQNTQDAKTAADAANAYVAKAVSDNILTPSEKIQIKLLWDDIKDEKVSIINKATIYSIPLTTYNARYDALSAIMTTINIDSTAEYVGTTGFGVNLRTAFATYYAARNAIITASDTSIKDKNDEISTWTGLNDAIVKAKAGTSLWIGGYLKIDLLDAALIVSRGGGMTELKFNSIVGKTRLRYIRNTTNGNTANSGNQWIEIQAFQGTKNVAQGKTVTGSSTPTFGTLSVVTNGITNVPSGYVELMGTNQYVTVDLGQIYDNIDRLIVWHYYADGRKYNKNKTEVSIDGIAWKTIYDSDITGTITETSDGQTMTISISALSTALVDEVNSRINSWMEDGIWSPLDKAALRDLQYTEMQSKDELIEKANSYIPVISSSSLVGAWTAFSNAIDIATEWEPDNIPVDPNFNTIRNVYFTAKKNLSKAIDDAITNKAVISTQSLIDNIGNLNLVRDASFENNSLSIYYDTANINVPTIVTAAAESISANINLVAIHGTKLLKIVKPVDQGNANFTFAHSDSAQRPTLKQGKKYTLSFYFRFLNPVSLNQGGTNNAWKIKYFNGDTQNIGSNELYSSATSSANLLNNSLSVTVTPTTNPYTYAALTPSIVLEPSTQYTLSIEKVELISGTTITNFTAVVHNATQNSTQTISTTLLISNTKQSITFTTTSVVGTGPGTWIILLYAGGAGSSQNRSLKFTKVQLEKGAVATTWSANSYDPTISDSWRRYTATFTALHDGLIDLVFGYDRAQKFTMYLDAIQIEEGSQATMFKLHTLDVALELSNSANQAIDNFIENEYANDLAALQTQIDGKIQSWNQDTDPSTSWTTNDLKLEHTGDLWYAPTAKTIKRWSGTAWTDVNSAQAEAAIALATSKKRIFVAQPIPPYNVADLWLDGSPAELKRSIVDRATGSYVAGDWIKAVKYTDDSRLKSWTDDGVFSPIEKANLREILTRETVEWNNLINIAETTYSMTGLTALKQSKTDFFAAINTILADTDELTDVPANFNTLKNTYYANKEYLKFTIEEQNIDLTENKIQQSVDLFNSTLFFQKYNKIRYIRDWLNGNTVNTGNHWTEIKVMTKTGINRATGSTVTSSATPISGSLANIINNVTNNTGEYASLPTGLQSVTIDLGAVYDDISQIIVWHYYVDARRYNATKTEVSQDGIRWFTVYDSAVLGTYIETSQGNTIQLKSSVLLDDIALNGIIDLAKQSTFFIEGGYLQGSAAFIDFVKAKAIEADLIAAINLKVTGQINANRLNVNQIIINGGIATTTEATNIANNAASTAVTNVSIGGNNLLLKSGTVITNNTYNIAQYGLTQVIENSTQMTVTIWGTLGSDRNQWLVYNSGANTQITILSSGDQVSPGVYRKTFNWVVGSSTNTILYIWQAPTSGTSSSIINKIKLEKGNKGTDWSPAPEDADNKISNIQTGIRNLIKNSSFELEQQNYFLSNSLGTVALTTEQSLFGTKSLKFTCVTNAAIGTPAGPVFIPTFGATGGSQLGDWYILPLIKGKTVSISVRVKAVGGTIGKTVFLRFFKDNVTANAITSASTTLNGEWQTLQVLADIPSNSTLISIQVLSENIVAGNILYTDNYSLVVSNVLVGDWSAAPEDDDAKINNLQTGIRNLVKNSSFELTEQNYYSVPGTPARGVLTLTTEQAYHGTKSLKFVSSIAANTSVTASMLFIPTFGATGTAAGQNGDLYTLSSMRGKTVTATVMVKGSGSSIGKNIILRMFANHPAVPNNWTNGNTKLLTSTWQQINVTMFVPEDVSLVALHVLSDNAAINDTWYIDAFQFVVSNVVPADWSPAPEDTDTKIADVKVGGTNLILNSAAIAFLPAVTGSGTSVLNNSEAEPFYRATPNTGQNVTIYGASYTYSPNETYISSIYVRQNSGSPVNINFVMSSAGLGYTATNTILQSGVWTRIKTLPFTDTALRNFVLSLGTGNVALDYKKAKTEKGNKETDWSPAPEDGTKALNDLVQTLDQTAYINGKIEKAKLGTSILIGGYFENSLIQTSELWVRNSAGTKIGVLMTADGKIKADWIETNSLIVKRTDGSTGILMTGEKINAGWIDTNNLIVRKTDGSTGVLMTGGKIDAQYLNVSEIITVSAFQDALSTAVTAGIGNIKIGGTNFFGYDDYTVYNNFGLTNTFVKTTNKYLDAPIYRLTITSNAANQFPGNSTGVYFLTNGNVIASKTYIASIYWKVISVSGGQSISALTGTAKNNGTRIDLATVDYANGWKRSAVLIQNSTDNVYWSITIPGAPTGTQAVVEFAAPQLEEGTILSGYTLKASNIIQKIDDIKVGGRNLLLNTKTLLSSQYQPLRTSTTYQGLTVAKATGVAAYIDIFQQTSAIPVTSNEYTLSFFARVADGGSALTINSYFYSPNTTTTGVSSQNTVSTATDGAIAITITTEWKRYWITWQQSTTTVQKVILIGRLNGNAGRIYEIAGPKLEEGNKATDWSPAPEDVDTRIDDIPGDGINLLLGTKFDYPGWSTNLTPTTKLNDGVLDIKGASGHGLYQYFSVKPNTSYTFSIDIKVVSLPTLSTTKIGFEFNLTYITINDVNNWKRYSVTVTTNTQTSIAIVLYLGENNANYLLRNPKVEIGKVATPYTEAPSDTEKRINAEAVSVVGDRNYVINSRLDNLNSVVGVTSSSIVNDLKFGKVVHVYRDTNTGNFQITRTLSNSVTELYNTDVVYFVIAKQISVTGEWYFGGWSDTFNFLNNDQKSKKIDLGDGWKVYWTTFKSGSTLGGGVFGINSLQGEWEFYAFGVQKGTKYGEWKLAPEDTLVEIGGRNFVNNSDVLLTTKGSSQYFNVPALIGMQPTNLTISSYLEFSGATGGRIGFEAYLTYEGGGGEYINAWFNAPTDGSSFVGRFSKTFKINKKKIINVTACLITDQLNVGATVTKFGRPMIEEGTRASSWIISEEDLQDTIQDARDIAEDNDILLGKLLDDGVLLPAEKLELLQPYTDIVNEYPSLLANAQKYGISTGGGSILNQYIDAYNNIINNVGPLLAGGNINTESNANGTTIRGYFNTYADKKIKLITETSNLAKTYTDTLTQQNAIGSLVPSLEKWVISGTLHNIATISDSKDGNKVLQIASDSGNYIHSNTFIPVNREATYKHKFWARKTLETATGALYFGFRHFTDSNFSSVYNNGNGGWGHYKPSTAALTTTWQLFEFETPGSEFPTDVKFFLPAFLDKYGGNAVGYFQISGFTITNNTDISNIEIGGTNLILDSNTDKSATTYLVGSYTLTEDWELNREYTLSLKGTINGIASTAAYWLPHGQGGVGLLGNAIYDTDKGIYKLTFIRTTAMPNPRILELYKSTNNTGPGYIDWIKLEKGNKNTAWSPAPQDVDNKIDNISVSGVNLIANSKTLSSNTSGGTKTTKYLDFNIAEAGTNGDAFTQTINSTESLEYTVSFYAKSSLNNSTAWCFFYSPNTTILATSSQGNTSNRVDGGIIITLTTDWKRYWITWKQSATASNKILILGRGIESGVTTSIAAPIMVRGNKPADWSPAPQDIDTAITNIISNDILDASEKPGERQTWDIISSEKASINAQATLYSITTENTTYNTAFQTLATYLNAGVTYSSGVPTWLNDANLSTNHTIVGATYRANWKSYYDARTALLNAITAKAKQLADNAQSSVDNIKVGTINLLDNSAIERTGGNEYLGVGVHTVLANLVGKQVTIAFDIKTPVPGAISIYTLGRYTITPQQNVSVTAEYQRFKLTFTVGDAGSGGGNTYTNLSFYGVYGTGRIPTVKNIMIVEGNRIPETWSESPADTQIRIAAAQTKADNAQSSVDNIKVGGKNYYQTASTISPFNGATAIEKTATGLKVKGVTANNAQIRINNVIKSNGWWTISFEAKCEIAGWGIGIDICDQGSQSFMLSGVDWKYITLSVNVTNYGVNPNTFNFVDIDTLSNQTFEFRNIMIEASNKASDYVPAIEDTATDITNQVKDAIKVGTTNLLIKSNVQLIRLANGAYLIGLYSLSTALVIGKTYTIYVNGSNSGGGAIGLWQNASIVINASTIVNESNVTKRLVFTAGMAATSIQFYHTPSGTAAGDSTVNWATLYEGDVKAPEQWIESTYDILKRVQDVQDDADALDAAIAAVSNDNKLSRFEKPDRRKEWEKIVIEKTDMLNKAAISSFFGIEITNFSNAFTALANYLNGGTAWSTGWPLWLSDARLQVDETIVGTVMRTYYSNYTSTLVAANTAVTNHILSQKGSIYPNIGLVPNGYKKGTLVYQTGNSFDNGLEFLDGKIYVAIRDWASGSQKRNDFVLEEATISIPVINLWTDQTFNFIGNSNWFGATRTSISGESVLFGYLNATWYSSMCLKLERETIYTFRLDLYSNGTLTGGTTNHSSGYGWSNMILHMYLGDSPYNMNTATSWGTILAYDTAYFASGIWKTLYVTFKTKGSVDTYFSSYIYNGTSEAAFINKVSLHKGTSREWKESAKDIDAGFRSVFTSPMYVDNTTTLGKGFLATNTIYVGPNPSNVNSGISGIGTDPTDIRFWSGVDFPARTMAPFRVQHDGTVISTKGLIGGWTIEANVLKSHGGYVGLANAQYSTDISIWAGNTDRYSAPFRVQANGVIFASSGTIGGWTLSSNEFSSNSGAMGFNASATGTGVMLWSGNNNKNIAPFRVQADGAMFASSGAIGGFTIGTYELRVEQYGTLPGDVKYFIIGRDAMEIKRLEQIDMVRWNSPNYMHFGEVATEVTFGRINLTADSAYGATLLRLKAFGPDQDINMQDSYKRINDIAIYIEAGFLYFHRMVGVDGQLRSGRVKTFQDGSGRSVMYIDGSTAG